MKASELRDTLDRLITEHGDQDVMIDLGVDNGGLAPVVECDMNADDDDQIIIWPFGD